jgi:HAD superfamily hydrolase (TIGR01509 family)
MRPDLVIFDCDGVLVDSEPTSTKVLATALTAAGVPTSPADALTEYAGLKLSQIAERAEQKLGGPLPPGFIESYERAREDAFRRSLLPVPGAAATIRALTAAGIATCVASQGKLAKTELTLSLTDLRPLFGQDVLFSSYEVDRGKPQPDLFLHAAKTMGVTPTRCVVVEDSHVGLAAGLAAGMRVFAYAPHGKGSSPLLPVGIELLGSLPELITVLGIGALSS